MAMMLETCGICRNAKTDVRCYTNINLCGSCESLLALDPDLCSCGRHLEEKHQVKCLFCRCLDEAYAMQERAHTIRDRRFLSRPKCVDCGLVIRDPFDRATTCTGPRR